MTYEYTIPGSFPCLWEDIAPVGNQDRPFFTFISQKYWDEDPYKDLDGPTSWVPFGDTYKIVTCEDGWVNVLVPGDAVNRADVIRVIRRFLDLRASDELVIHEHNLCVSV